MASTFQKQIAELEEDRALLEIFRTHAVSDGGKLTAFGKDFVHSCVKHGVPNGTTARLVGVTTSAITQQAAKLK